nr:hypothetical protein [Ralstonia solanacearum]
MTVPEVWPSMEIVTRALGEAPEPTTVGVLLEVRTPLLADWPSTESTLGVVSGTTEPLLAAAAAAPPPPPPAAAMPTPTPAAPRMPSSVMVELLSAMGSYVTAESRMPSPSAVNAASKSASTSTSPSCWKTRLWKSAPLAKNPWIRSSRPSLNSRMRSLPERA